MVPNTSRKGKYIPIMKENLVCVVLRYEKELSHARWNSVRKGAVFGLYSGWLLFVTFIIYAVGFIFGAILMSYEDEHASNISDVLVVSD